MYFKLLRSPKGVTLYQPCDQGVCAGAFADASAHPTLVPKKPRAQGIMSEAQWYIKHRRVIDTMLRSIMHDIVSNVNVTSEGQTVVWDTWKLRSALMSYMYRTSASKHRSYHLLK